MRLTSDRFFECRTIEHIRYDLATGDMKLFFGTA